MSNQPAYVEDSSEFIESNISHSTPLLATCAALLSDPSAYSPSKGQPVGALVDFVHEQILTNRPLQAYLQDPDTPVSRVLIDGKWQAVWRYARESSTSSRSSFDYDVCISFAGTDRKIAEEIAVRLESNGMNRRVFYDEFEEVDLFGEELIQYLYEVFAHKSMFCLILFSHAYRQKVWTRHELRAALTRVLQERGPYVLPVELDRGAIPDLFRSVGYLQFQAGGEQRIADAVEEKINTYIGEHYFSMDEVVKTIGHNSVAEVVLDRFRLGIRERADAGDLEGAQILAILALIAAASAEYLGQTIRALIDHVLYTAGPVGDFFENDIATVFGEAAVRRCLGPRGPLLLSKEGWPGIDGDSDANSDSDTEDD